MSRLLKEVRIRGEKYEICLKRNQNQNYAGLHIESSSPWGEAGILF